MALRSSPMSLPGRGHNHSREPIVLAVNHALGVHNPRVDLPCGLSSCRWTAPHFFLGARVRPEASFSPNSFSSSPGPPFAFERFGQDDFGSIGNFFRTSQPQLSFCMCDGLILLGLFRTEIRRNREDVGCCTIMRRLRPHSDAFCCLSQVPVLSSGYVMRRRPVRSPPLRTRCSCNGISLVLVEVSIQPALFCPQ